MEAGEARQGKQSEEEGGNKEEEAAKEEQDKRSAWIEKKKSVPFYSRSD